MGCLSCSPLESGQEWGHCVGNAPRLVAALPGAGQRSCNGLLLFKYLRREGLDSRAVPPSIGRQSCFEASLFEEPGPVPLPFHGHLGQQQPAAQSTGNVQPVLPHFHFFRPHGVEARILKRGAQSAFTYGLVERHHGLNAANTTAQVARLTQCHKSPGGFFEGRGDWSERRKALRLNFLLKSTTSQLQQKLLLSFGERQHLSLLRRILHRRE